MEDDTIVRVPFEVARNEGEADLSAGRSNGETKDAVPGGVRLFAIRCADSAGQRSSASILINRMYATRGYRSDALGSQGTPERVTLVASDDEATMATLSIGLDGTRGLLADQLFAREIDALRSAGRSVCEFIKLAIDSSVRSRRVLASLFHVAFIQAHGLGGIDHVVIEVNPRHARYYQRMLGFTQAGPVRLNPRVNAPAVLLELDLAHADRQIAHFGGQPDRALEERSLYPFFFSAHEHAGIAKRLRQRYLNEAADWSASDASGAGRRAAA